MIVPTRGDSQRLSNLLDSLDAQTLPRERWNLVVAFDGTEPSTTLRDRMHATGVAIARLPVRRGPGAARNEAARLASGEFLAFTEDDCTAATDWLARADDRADLAVFNDA